MGTEPGPLRSSQRSEREGARGRTHRCFRMTFCDSSEYDFRSRSIAWYFLSMSFTPARTPERSVSAKNSSGEKDDGCSRLGGAGGAARPGQGGRAP